MIGSWINARRGVMAIVAAGLGAAAALSPVASAQDVATPVVETGPQATTGIFDVDGNQVGTATFITGDTGVSVTIDVDGLPPGEHGIHIHETGICDPTGDEPFSSAGGHFNPTGSMHGAPLLATPGATPIEGEEHAGDLANIEVNEQGSGMKTFETDLISLDPNQPDSLNDMDGSAIVIHADPDDLVTDPSGDSGARIACGVIFGPMTEASPIATETVMP